MNRSVVQFMFLLCMTTLWGCAVQPLEQRIQGTWRDTSQGWIMVFDLQADPPTITAMEEREEGGTSGDSLSIEHMQFQEDTNRAFLRSEVLCAHFVCIQLFYDLQMRGTGSTSVMHLMVHDEDYDKVQELTLERMPDDAILRSDD